MPGNSPSPRLSAWIVLAMLAMVAVPAGITLHTIRVAAVPQICSTNPTPHGYTWSLLLFVVPIVVIGGWFLPSEGLEIPQRAFWRTICILVICGFGLDFFFANRFFVYRNAAATLGIPARALACFIHEGAGVGCFWADLADRRAVSGMAHLPCRCW